MQEMCHCLWLICKFGGASITLHDMHILCCKWRVSQSESWWSNAFQNYYSLTVPVELLLIWWRCHKFRINKHMINLRYYIHKPLEPFTKWILLPRMAWQRVNMQSLYCAGVATFIVFLSVCSRDLTPLHLFIYMFPVSLVWAPNCPYLYHVNIWCR